MAMKLTTNQFRDRMYRSTLDDIEGCAYGALSAMETRLPSALPGYAMLIILLCEKYGLRVNDVLDLAGRAINDMYREARSKHKRGSALMNFIEGEVNE